MFQDIFNMVNFFWIFAKSQSTAVLMDILKMSSTFRFRNDTAEKSVKNW